MIPKKKAAVCLNCVIHAKEEQVLSTSWLEKIFYDVFWNRRIKSYKLFVRNRIRVLNKKQIFGVSL